MAWLVQRGVDWFGALAGTNPPVELGANSVSGGDDNLSRVYSTAIDKAHKLQGALSTGIQFKFRPIDVSHALVMIREAW